MRTYGGGVDMEEVGEGHRGGVGVGLGRAMVRENFRRETAGI